MKMEGEEGEEKEKEKKDVDRRKGAEGVVRREDRTDGRGKGKELWKGKKRWDGTDKENERVEG